MSAYYTWRIIFFLLFSLKNPGAYYIRVRTIAGRIRYIQQPMTGNVRGYRFPTLATVYIGLKKKDFFLKSGFLPSTVLHCSASQYPITKLILLPKLPSLRGGFITWAFVRFLIRLKSSARRKYEPSKLKVLWIPETREYVPSLFRPFFFPDSLSWNRQQNILAN